MKELRVRRALCALSILASAALLGFRGGSAAYLLFWATLLVPLCSGVSLLILQRALVVSLEPEAEEVQRGSRVVCRLGLYNRSFLPVSFVAITLLSDKLTLPEWERSIRCSLAPGELRYLTFSPSARHCGDGFVGAESITLYDPFCLFRIRRKAERQIHVLPRTRPLRTLQAAPPREDERRRADRSYYAQSVPDGQLRWYVPGDDVRRIHWKATALQGRPIVRNLEPEPRDEIVLLPDGRAALPEGEAGWFAVDSVLEGTLTVADYFLRRGRVLRVIPDEDRTLTLDSAAAFHKLESQCARDFFTGTQRPDAVLERESAAGKTGPYILITWEIDQELLHCVSRCIRGGAAVTLIYVGTDPNARTIAQSEPRLRFLWATPRRDIFSVLGGTEGGAR